MLFTDDSFFDYNFPTPQYLGAKFIHRKWIAQFVSDNADNVLDAFSGSQSIAFVFKQFGKKVSTNDFLSFNYIIGKALIENKKCKLKDSDIDILFSENSNPGKFNLMEQLFSGLFFVREEAAFADSFRSNVEKLDNQYKQALALTVMCRSMTRKVTMGHFAHTRALVYAKDPARIKRNRSLVQPLKNIFLELLPDYNNAVFDNRHENISYNKNILDLLPDLNGIDLVYFDPPYCNSHADYQSFYHLLETYVEYWKDKSFVNGTKRYEPKRYSGFDKNSEEIPNFKLLFERASDIPVWLISYNNRSYPDIETMKDLIKPFRDVRIEYKTYLAGRGGKGSVAGSSEILLICTRKKNIRTS